MRYLISLLFIVFATMSYAVKMHPAACKVKQSDGTVLTVKSFGNHDFSYFTTTDGVLLFRHGTDFYVAEVDDDGMLRPSVFLAHETGARTAAEQKAIMAQAKVRFNENMRQNAERAKALREPLGENSTLLPHTGTPKVPVILVEFSDEKFTVSDPKTVFGKYLNGMELFNKTTDPEMGMNFGSVKRYFTDMSFGLFSPDFEVYGPVTLPNTLKYYGGGSSSSEKMNDLFRDACSAIDTDTDFSQYDSNGDGNIDLVYIIYAGYSESFAGNSSDCIYPKSGTLSGGMTFDGKKLCRYGVNNELNGTPADQEANGLLINGIGLFCHEFSHCMGLPDLYPSPGTLAERCINQNLDYWDLMDAGEYTYNGYRPTEYTGWERERFGWMTIDTLKSPCDVTLAALSAGGKAYRILNDKDESGKEYYIVENVQKTGWNKSLPGHGMLVYHVDYDDYMFSVGGCRVNNTAGHPRMSIIAADGIFMPEYFMGRTIQEGSTETEKELNADLVARYAGTEITNKIYLAEFAGDPYPGSGGVTALTDGTTPAAAWVYNGGFMGKPLTDIKEDTDAKTVSFKFMGGEEAGIRNVRTTAARQQIYSLDGRCLGTDISRLKKGVYVVGGKKVCL